MSLVVLLRFFYGFRCFPTFFEASTVFEFSIFLAFFFSLFLFFVEFFFSSFVAILVVEAGFRQVYGRNIEKPGKSLDV